MHKHQFLNLKYFFALLAFIASFNHYDALCQSQKLIQDSLIIIFPPVKINSAANAVSIDSVIDFRGVAKPRLVGIDEKTKYSFIPVDLNILLKQPLTQVVKDVFPLVDSTLDPHYSLGIHHIELSKKKSFLFMSRYCLNASVSVRQSQGSQDSLAQKELLYEVSCPKFLKGNNIKIGYEECFGKWLGDLKNDIQMIALNSNRKEARPFYNLRAYDAHAPWMQLNLNSSFILTPEGRVIDGQLFFTFPEAKRTSLKSAKILRYRKEKLFESIEMSLMNDFLLHRLNRIWQIKVSSQLLVGLNRWNDMKTKKHELYDAFIADFSLSQSLHYHPMNTRSVNFGFGFQEGMYYIYSKQLNFQIGILFQLGIQL
jgi:hypothetical protein